MPSKRGPSTDEIRAQLEAAGAEYDAARSAADNALAALNPLIVAALKAGIPPGEIQRAARVSHEKVRIARIGAGLPPAPRGGAR